MAEHVDNCPDCFFRELEAEFKYNAHPEPVASIPVRHASECRCEKCVDYETDSPSRTCVLSGGGIHGQVTIPASVTAPSPNDSTPGVVVEGNVPNSRGG